MKHDFQRLIWNKTVTKTARKILQAIPDWTKEAYTKGCLIPAFANDVVWYGGK